ncbi:MULTISPECIES: hypothetical protein [Methanosarcina]|uniref:Uncharacterized protein n=1 Tax=Methanosarcina barkeri CM1 TaxID=796385 RepID=A0A0G3C5Z3_METBA|nr:MULTISPECIES: hypothetical protein [Methanosarcina]AKJ37396.1 hypothetical protein MCM1_0283 [Methanosarcina barkeri CM1]
MGETEASKITEVSKVIEAFDPQIVASAVTENLPEVSRALRAATNNNNNNNKKAMEQVE